MSRKTSPFGFFVPLRTEGRAGGRCLRCRDLPAPPGRATGGSGRAASAGPFGGSDQHGEAKGGIRPDTGAEHGLFSSGLCAVIQLAATATSAFQGQSLAQRRAAPTHIGLRSGKDPPARHSRNGPASRCRAGETAAARIAAIAAAPKTRDVASSTAGLAVGVAPDPTGTTLDVALPLIGLILEAIFDFPVEIEGQKSPQTTMLISLNGSHPIIKYQKISAAGLHRSFDSPAAISSPANATAHTATARQSQPARRRQCSQQRQHLCGPLRAVSRALGMGGTLCRAWRPRRGGARSAR